MSETSHSKGFIGIVEDDTSLREGLLDLLSAEGYQSQGWPNAELFLKSFIRHEPMTIICDVRMNNISGVEMHRSLLEQGHSIPIVYISGASTLIQGIEAFKLGAIDFLTKPFSREAILKAISDGLEADIRQLEMKRRKNALEAALEKLSPREREVFPLLLKGFNNAEIMTSLDISLPTAKQYKSQIMQKLQLKTLSELIEVYKTP